MSGLRVDVEPGAEFIEKPFLPEQLLEKVRRILG